MDEAAREYDGGAAGWSWSATSWDGYSRGADNCAAAGGDGAADAILSGRNPWSCNAPFGSFDMGNRILRKRMCEIKKIFHKTDIMRTSHSSTTFGDKEVEDSTARRIGGGVLRSRFCAGYLSFSAVAVTSEGCGEVTSE